MGLTYIEFGILNNIYMRFTYTFEEACDLVDQLSTLHLLSTPRQIAQYLWDYCENNLPQGAKYFCSYISNVDGDDVNHAPNSTYYISADQDYDELHDNDIII